MKRPHLVNMMKKWLDFLLEILAFLFFVLALWLVYNEIQKIGWAQLLSLISQTPFYILLLALFFTLCDYMAFSGYDFLALKYIGKKLPKAKVIEAAMASFSVTNTTGHAYIAGGSLRYMLYSKQGLSEINVLKMIAFESVTYLLGMACVFDLALILSSFFHQSHNNLYIHWFYTGAILVSILVFLYFYFSSCTSVFAFSNSAHFASISFILLICKQHIRVVIDKPPMIKPIIKNNNSFIFHFPFSHIF